MKWMTLVFTLVFTLGMSPRAQSVELVDWGSDEGVARLERSKFKADFFKLANVFETQKNGFFCGPTSGAIVLNALRLGQAGFELPEDAEAFKAEYKKFLGEGMNPLFKKYTQNNFFNAQTAEVKTEAQVCGDKMNGTADYGIQLRQFASMFEAHGVKVTLSIVTDGAAVKAIREAFKKNLSDKTNFILVNYARKALGQTGGGHISPIGAYDEISDSFLIMDVNPNRAPWVWVKAEDLVKAMATMDTVENRGYLLLSN